MTRVRNPKVHYRLHKVRRWTQPWARLILSTPSRPISIVSEVDVRDLFQGTNFMYFLCFLDRSKESAHVFIFLKCVIFSWWAIIEPRFLKFGRPTFVNCLCPHRRFICSCPQYLKAISFIRRAVVAGHTATLSKTLIIYLLRSSQLSSRRIGPFCALRFYYQSNWFLNLFLLPILFLVFALLSDN
jgi:hypothetical protein